MLKMCVSALKSDGWNFVKFDKVKKNTLYVCFITRHGAARPNVDSIRIVIRLRIIVLGVIAKFGKNLQKGCKAC